MAPVVGQLNAILEYCVQCKLFEYCTRFEYWPRLNTDQDLNTDPDLNTDQDLNTAWDRCRVHLWIIYCSWHQCIFSCDSCSTYVFSVND